MSRLHALAALPAIDDEEHVTVVIETPKGSPNKYGFIPSTLDRLLAVTAQSHTSGPIGTLDDLRPHLLDEIEAFFGHYVALQGREIEIGGRQGPRRARELLDAGMARSGGRG